MFKDEPYDLSTLDRIDFSEAFVGQDGYGQKRYVFLFKGYKEDTTTDITFVFNYKKSIQEADFLEITARYTLHSERASYFFRGKEALKYFKVLAEKNKVKILLAGFDYKEFLN